MKLKIKKLINVLQYDKTQSEIIVLKNDKIIIRKGEQEGERSTGEQKIHIMQNRKMCIIKRKNEKLKSK